MFAADVKSTPAPSSNIPTNKSLQNSNPTVIAGIPVSGVLESIKVMDHCSSLSLSIANIPIPKNQAEALKADHENTQLTNSTIASVNKNNDVKSKLEQSIKKIPQQNIDSNDKMMFAAKQFENCGKMYSSIKLAGPQFMSNVEKFINSIGDQAANNVEAAQLAQIVEAYSNSSQNLHSAISKLSSGDHALYVSDSLTKYFLN